MHNYFPKALDNIHSLKEAFIEHLIYIQLKKYLVNQYEPQVTAINLERKKEWHLNWALNLKKKIHCPEKGKTTNIIVRNCTQKSSKTHFL